MSNNQQLQKVTWLGLGLILWILGCDNSGKKSSPEMDRPATQSDRTEAKRAPRSLREFKEVLAEERVGAIQGEVIFLGRPPEVPEIPVTLDKHVCGKAPKQAENLLISEQGRIQNAVISLLRIPKGLPANVAGASLQLDQRKCIFIPHILIVPVKTEFDVLNSDRVMHNFHAISVSNKEINVNQTKTRRRKLTVSYTQPEIVSVVCDVHSWMRAWIIVTEHPYYSVTDQDGQFRLENVPEGNYRVKAWHEELGEQIREITVAKDKVAALKFEFSAAP